MTEFCIFTEPQVGADYDTQLAHARATESLGLHGWFRSDHYMTMDSGDGLPGPTDAWTTLAGLARETSRLRLGTLVSSATHRYPAILAIQVAQVDAMSGGRIDLGLGTGWFEAEHLAYGIPFPAKRFDRLEEQLEVITGLWATPVGETFSFEGAHYRLVDAPALPKPLQSPLPLIIGGRGARRTPELAARFAHEYNIGFADEDTIRSAIARVRERADAAGRSLRYSVALPTVVGATEAEFRARAGRIGADPASFGPVGIGGSVQATVDKLGRLIELGADRVYLQLVDMSDLEHLDLIGREVLPRLG
ncbi:MAG: TIGR03560 family F420-dependent LLM class oxidoreductase [Microbacteriaceae bacterium]